MVGVDWMLVVGLGGFVATVVIGAPLTRALAEPGEWRARRRRPRTPNRDRSVVTTGFTPLEFGEDPMRWPSERPWPEGIEPPPWPSETWNDEYFGRVSRGDARSVGEEAGDEGATTSAHPRRSPERTTRRQPRTSGAARPPARRAGRSSSEVPTSPDRDSARLPAVIPPHRDELEQLIATIGLAGTVQDIMKRTGWDFRQAAHYLAKIRQRD